MPVSRSICRGRRFLVGIISLALVSPSVGQAVRTLSFEERVQAQEAIERVSYEHQVGTTTPFDQAVPRSLLEKKVRTYLKQTVALETFWETPVTAVSLRAEMARIEHNTRLPGRLREIYVALDNDAFLIQECLVRATLVDRLTRERFASDPRSVEGSSTAGWDDWWADVEPELDAQLVEAVAAESETGHLVAETCVPDDTWSPLSVNASLMPRSLSTAVWTGSLMIVWGGADTSGPASTGGRYDPTLDTWTPTSAAGAPAPRSRHTAVWTGRDMVIWGGSGSTEPLATGGRYNPLTDTWTSTTMTGAPSARVAHTAIWTGDSVVIWGGATGEGYTNTGGRYDPVRDLWTPTSTKLTTPVPSARGTHSAVWTGQMMLVWGGSGAGGSVNTGGFYEPADDYWYNTTSIGPDVPAARSGHVAVWTGDSMIVWGGTSAGFPVNTGGQLRDGVWTPTSTVDAPSPRTATTAIWTGTSMVIWGGEPAPPPMYARINTGGRYDPLADSWSPTALIGAPGPRSYHTAVWTGSAMLVHGGSEAGGSYAIGGLPDADADGFRGCDGDCDDTDPAVNPGAAEICNNGVDEDCDGVADVLPGSGAGCDTQQPGVCGAGIMKCSNGALQCVAHVASSQEVCNGLDDDCDGVTDDVPGAGAACTTGQPGVCSAGTMRCFPNGLLCYPNEHPWYEQCDGLDNDCNGIVDDLPPVATTCGSGACASSGAITCVQGVLVDSCIPRTPSPEVCDGLDNDCDGSIPSMEADADHDGVRLCQGDCNDLDGSVRPNVVESCDGKDNNCDGILMLGGESDDDGDHVRTCAMQYCIDPYQRWCTGDCDDHNPQVYPNAPELCGDGVINSCIARLWRLHGGYCLSGTWNEVDDCDQDGFTGCEGDCNDHHSLIGPATPEACDGLDNDCDGIVDDGVGSSAIDIPGDPQDQDCLNGPACDPAAAWPSHGAYVSCVETVCEQLKKAHLLTGRECDDIVTAAATGQWGGP